MKLCCFRFDADTHACVSQGMPRLVELGDRLGARFTFFVNMGRAFDPRVTARKALGRVFRGRERHASASSLSAAYKLGWRESLRAAVFNPRAGRSDPAALRGAARSGHEVGLHGGRNHAGWERLAHTWDEDRLHQEVQTGRRWLEESGIEAGVTAFASPAWNSPAGLRRVLPACGFHVLADTYDGTREDVAVIGGHLLSVPTNVTAVPGSSAGYLEAMHQRGWDARQIARDFRRQLTRKEHLAVVYDHPFFAGIHALDQVGELVRVALDEGFQVETVSAAAHRLAPLVAATASALQG